MAKYRKSYSTGGAIGATAGSILGSIIPGVGTAIGGAAGSLIGGLFDNNQEIKEPEKAVESPTKFKQGGLLNSIDAGGKHNQNPLGGVPIGKDVSVEQGETMTDDFVYSDAIKINKTLASEFNLPKKVIGKTFAEASKLLTIDQTDNISERGNKAMLSRLAEAQESFKSANNLKNKSENNSRKQLKWGDPLSLFKNGFDLLSGNNTNISAKNDGTVNDDSTDDGTSETNNKKGDNLFNPLRYAPIAGDLYNLNYISKNKPKDLNAADFQTNSKIEENLVNREQARKDIKEAGSTAGRTIKEASAGNQALLAALSQNQNIGTQKALGEFQMQSDAMDSQEKARVQSARAAQDQFNASVNMNIQNLNDQNKGMYSSTLMDSVSNLFQNIGGVGQEQTNINMVNEMFGYDVHGRYKRAMENVDESERVPFTEWLKRLFS